MDTGFQIAMQTYNVGAVPNEAMRIFYDDRRLEEVRAWLDAGGDPNAMEESRGVGVQLTILSRAANCGATAVVRLLLERGADPNKLNGVGKDWGNALNWAARSRYARPELIEALVAHGVDVNATDRMCRNTSLHQATTDIIRLPNVNVLVALLRAGTDPAARDICGHTAECNAIGLINPSYSSSLQACIGDIDPLELPQSPEEYYHAKAVRDLLRDVRLAGGTWRAYLDATRHSLTSLRTLCERKRALVRAGRTRRATPAVYALLFSSAVPQELFRKVLSYVFFGPSSTVRFYRSRPVGHERDTEYWRTYLTLEGLPVPDDLNDVPFGDPKELPGWVEDESTSDY